MTATDELRRLLDDRGVEWWAEDEPEVSAYYFVTKWFANGCEQTYEEIPAIRSRSLKAYCLTPEQAVEATLGRGTCRECAGMEDVFECSACGMRFEGWALKRWARYCPNCGRRIEVDA